MFNKLLYGTISSRVRRLSHRLLSEPLAAPFLQTRTVVVRPKHGHFLRNEFPLTKSAFNTDFITNSRGFNTHSSSDQPSEGWLAWLRRKKKVIALVTIRLLALGGRKLDSWRVVRVGDLGLHELVREVSPEEIGSERIEKVIDDLVKVMRKHKLASLSAPQIGVPLEIIVLDDKLPFDIDYEAEDKLRFEVTFNPKLSQRSRKKGLLFESCESVPGYEWVAEWERLINKQWIRYDVRVIGLNRYGHPSLVYASRWYARNLQRACDYQGGAMYDKMD